MIKTKRKAIYICAVAAGLTILSGCTNKKKDIEYVDDSVVASSSDAEEISTGDKLHDKLGIGEEKEWKDKVGRFTVSAWLEVPDVNSMYIQKFEEYYYTNADKQKFLESVFDKDSQRVDTMSIDYPCRESIEAKIREYEERIEISQDLVSDIDDAKIDIEYYNKRIDELRAQLSEVPARADVSTSVGDYSANQYRASINGIEYSIKFKIDPDNNVSRVVVIPIDYSLFNSMNLFQTPFENSDIKDAEGLNVSEKGYDKLKDEAEKFVDSLGITGFVVSDTAMLQYYNYESADDFNLGEYEYNGYSFLFTRQIADLAVGCECFCDLYGYHLTENRPYLEERIIVKINDTGLVGFAYDGIMKPVSEPSAVKLLAYEDIKQICKKSLENSNRNTGDYSFKRFRLGYERVASEDLPDTYCYVPTWKLDGAQTSGYLIDILDNNYFISINAIDGSVTDSHNRVLEGTYEDYYYDIFEYINYR